MEAFSDFIGGNAIAFCPHGAFFYGRLPIAFTIQCGEKSAFLGEKSVFIAAYLNFPRYAPRNRLADSFLCNRVSSSVLIGRPCTKYPGRCMKRKENFICSIRFFNRHRIGW